MSDYSYMKKGVQYSHYIGGDLAEIQAGIELALDKDLHTYMEGEEASNEHWASYVKKRVSDLRDKIAYLDRINELEY